MCDCGSSTPAPPVPSAPPSGPVACGKHGSAVQLLDELGIPLAGATVDVTINGVTSRMTADGTGTLCFADPPGTSVRVALADSHDVKAGDSTATPSGRHFRAGGDGP